MKRLNKEYSLNLNEYIDVKYGTVDRERPLVVYIEGKTWITPSFNGDYEEPINNVMKNFKKSIKRSVLESSLLENKFVFDFDVKTASLVENKKSFMSFDIYVKQPDKEYKEIKDVKKIILNGFKSIIDDLADNLSVNNFKLSKTKR